MMEARRERIGRYVVLAELGRGAMGVVYRAHDPQLDRQVAIKTVRRDLGLPPEEDAQLRKRVHQEATAAGRLTHPSIVAIYDVLELDAIPYIVMEYVEGRTLADLIAKGPLPSSRAVRLVAEVCSGLEYAHAHGVVHRDVKPSNILVMAGGAAKVGDFGIARIAGSHVTRTGAILGTPAYMAPEQLRGLDLDGRSDIFALGVTLYEALTGVQPFQGDDLVALLYQIAHEAPVPLSRRNPAVPPALEPVIERAMAKHPEERYATAAAFAHALVHAMAADTLPAARSRGVASRSQSRRRRGRTRLVAVACLALVAVGGWAAWARRAPDRPAVAERTVLDAAPEPEPAPLLASLSPAAAGTPAGSVAVPPAVEPEQPAAPASAADPPAGPVKPVEEPPPMPSDLPVKTPPPPAERTPPRPVPVPGAIRVVTDPSVDVLLDGKYRGRTKGSPLVVPKVAPGERMVTLRLHSREQTLFAAVSSGETATVTYRFPSELPHTPASSALGKIREGVEKAQRETAGAIRDILDGADPAKRGRDR
jgi:tRNA A-37 threonylcarbamoyl transferase component Bud32